MNETTNMAAPSAAAVEIEPAGLPGGTAGTTSTVLPAWVAADLARSGITPEMAETAGIRGVTPDQYDPLLGFSLPGMPAGYVIPFRDPQTSEPMCTKTGREFVRIRFERPVRIGDSDAKYASPSKAGNRAYIPRAAHEAALRGEPLVITEGEKKAICATANGIPTIGLVGVFGFCDGGTRDLLADLHPYITTGRDVTFVVDSDAAVNHDITQAAARFSTCARLRGCALKVLVLPASFETTGDGVRTVKAGMDDLIVKEGPARMQALLESAVALQGTTNDVYVGWLNAYMRASAAAQIDPAVLADEIVRKGFLDKTNDATRRRILVEAAQGFRELVLAIDAAVHQRLDAEFAGASTLEHGGENLTVGRYVRVPGSDDTWRIEALQEDIAWCCAPRAHSSRPFPRRLIELAPRSAGAENGAAGGRPRGPSATEITNAFLAQPQFTSNGICLLRLLRGQWYQYGGTRYRPIQERDVSSAAMQFLRQHPIYSETATTKTQTDVMSQLRAFDAAGIPSETVLPVWIEADGLLRPATGWTAMRNKLVNIENLVRSLNGEVVAESEIVQPHTPRIFTPFGLDYDFDPSAACPLFEGYLVDVQPEAEDREVVQMLMGLCLVPDTRYNVFFLLVGKGGEGKSVLLHVIVSMLGDANVCNVPFSKFTDKFSIGLLTEHLVNIIGEGDTELPRDVGLGRVEGVLKDVCDGGLLPVEHKFHEPSKARAMARCLAASNAIPSFYDRSEAIWDRLRVLPFNVRIRGTPKEDTTLRQRIVTTELPGIFNFAVQGLAKLRQRRQFPEMALGIRMKSEHRGRCDHEREFLTEHYAEANDANPIQTQVVFLKYRSWMSTRNYHSLGEANFGTSVTRVFPGVRKDRTRDKDGKQFNAWMGLRETEVTA